MNKVIETGEPPRAYAHGIKSALSRVQDELAPNLFLVTKIFFNILHRRFGDYYIHGFIPMVLRSLYKLKQIISKIETIEQEGDEFEYLI